jgi:hypothetical protein
MIHCVYMANKLIERSTSADPSAVKARIAVAYDFLLSASHAYNLAGNIMTLESFAGGIDDMTLVDLEAVVGMADKALVELKDCGVDVRKAYN